MAQAAASSVTRDMETAMHRLSTGKRINAAADDAAGVAISSRLDSTVRGLNQSIRNALDAQALIDTAEGGMQETETILQRIRELSIQASNDTNSANDRANLNAEAQSLLSEIDRISSSTTWAGQSLLDGTFTDKRFQVGTGTMASDQLVTSISGVSSGYLGLSGSSGSTITTPQKIGSEFQINTFTTNGQQRSKVAALDSGEFVVVWKSHGQDQTGSTSSGVFGQIFSASGEEVGIEFQINTYTDGTQDLPSVSSLAEGGFIVAWESYGQNGNNLQDIYGQRYDDSGSKVGSEFQINSNTNNGQRYPSVVSLDDGFLVVWKHYAIDVAGQWGIAAQRFDANGDAVGSEFSVASIVDHTQEYPEIDVLSDGSFVVTWQRQSDGSNVGVFGQRFDSSAAKIGLEFQINTYTTGDQNESSVASLPDGGFVVTWQSDGQDGDNNGIFGQRYNASGIKVGSEFQVNTQAAGSQEYSTVIGLSDGGFLTAWSSSSNHADGSGYGIYGQRYDSSGNTVGDEFQINTYVSGDQDRISLEQLSDGSIVASWTSDGQDGDGDGIFAQIFDLGATNVDLTTMSNSQSAISLVDSALQSLNSQRASLGAISNRLDHIVAYNTNAATNVVKSLGRIQDADFAAES
ncbi:flagellin, partial [Paracoccaceae bacterium]|nr:flagellin [Paracoccaceae bacterium]